MNQFIIVARLLICIAFYSCENYDLARSNHLDNNEEYLPTIHTTSIYNISDYSAAGGGNVTSEGSSEVTARGVCWSTAQNPTIFSDTTLDGTGAGSFTSVITGLSSNTTYYVRAYATNSSGTAYGTQVSFMTGSGAGTVTDIDGNIYHTVTIGTQVWMVENLKTTHYRNGDTIPNVTDDTQWGTIIIGAYCNYDHNPSNVTTYGRMYNWYAANESRNIAPAGWHVPTDEDWTLLINYLGGGSVAGGKLKESGTAHWNSPNTGATNETGFTALPGGDRGTNGVFESMGIDGKWWSSTEAPLDYAWRRFISYYYANVDRDYASKTAGFSIRCVKD